MRALALYLISLVSGAASAHAESDRFTLVPDDRLFPLTFADPREIRTFVAFNNGREIHAAVGSYQSLFSVTPEDKRWAMHFGLEGRGYFVMRQEGGRFPLETVDGTLGLYLEYAQGPWQTQLRYTHVSAHLADGSTGIAIPYSREMISLRASFAAGQDGQLYVGAHKLVNTIPRVHGLSLQFGGNYFFPWEGRVTPYIAGDLRWQEESKVNPSFALQLGIALQQPGRPRDAFRIYYSYFTGVDIRGQYYRDTRTYHGFAIEFAL